MTILTSTKKLTCSTYQMSFSNCSWYKRTLPVLLIDGHSSPGFTAVLILCRSEYLSSKEDGTPINGRDALNAILGTNGYYYETPPLITPEEIENNEYVNEAAINGMIADLEKKSIGLSGENLSMLMPDAVRTDTEGRLCIDYNAVVTMLVEAMKQQQEEIEALRQALQENGLLQK